MNIQITLSERQAHITAEALEFFMRTLIGQIDMPDAIKWRPENKDRDYEELRRACDHIKQLLFPELMRGASYGVGWNDKPEQQQAQIAYEIYKAIYYERNQREGINNVHSYPALHYSKEPVPTVVAIP
ncbi:hypothetical protein [Hymenobacter sp. GOD-10R]|uniref:hypothetical protein n=1 Tax=Hymenobacter sp. GOD-10R TaxID=3093922 RepID=UPI002D7858FA|nr:hypothetical protein [Hymenobacter sp. GOD-10R]WRQ26694.1 hypothetical protein SD425_16600 [Hymenobacter sp. GOD-10R]